MESILIHLTDGLNKLPQSDYHFTAPRFCPGCSKELPNPLFVWFSDDGELMFFDCDAGGTCGQFAVCGTAIT